jgi:hypothetical protein
VSPVKPSKFDYVVGDTEAAITQFVIWTLFKQRAAPIVVTNSGAHWVVVVDYFVSQNPTGPEDDTYEITEIQVKDPAPVLIVDEDPPPHTTGDGCGTGSEKAMSHSLRHMPYALWQTEYMQPIVKTPNTKGLWKDKFVAVCEMDPVDTLSSLLLGSKLERRQANLLRRSISAPRYELSGEDGDEDGDEELGSPPPPDSPQPELRPLLRIEDAQNAVREALGKFQLLAMEPWNRLLVGTEPGIPVPVERLDFPGLFYYIVPMEVQDGPGAPVAVIIDAHDGSYRESAAVLERYMTALPSAISAPGTRFAWEPSVESFSPFYPFVRSNDRDRPGFYRLGNPGKTFRRPRRNVLGF